eukprot:CAMPEP_0117894732 /NCGR_PEP_ID=MMETSP0950-20121206/26178_1 /TAXON_ID=44440 /ORGANISM="Chattonella subsalsa, Strain CCMP2191" /LENGTH=538 /DNA_ID=CAMNT_0005755401 /DNA_START=46 /DNA_END=1663 /DNA_ORIENTATION=+
MRNIFQRRPKSNPNNSNNSSEASGAPADTLSKGPYPPHSSQVSGSGERSAMNERACGRNAQVWCGYRAKGGRGPELAWPPSPASRADSVKFSTIKPFRHLKDLPPLKHAALQKRDALFQQKLQLCSVVFVFDDPDIERSEKEIKRQTLLEMVDYVTTPAGQKIFAEQSMPEIMNMVKANIIRTLPPETEDYDPEDEEPVYEPAWPHLQVVYEFFLRFIVSSEVSAKVAKKYINQKFVHQFIELFNSEDPRERDYLKTILHRIYGKFMSLRSYIRREVSNVFFRFVYETERHNGIGELLEILGSIINGFAIPLKHEHLTFLQRALNPLHKPACVALYHQQLSYCLIQYVQKDPDTGVLILQALIKFWPWSCSSKQLLFMNELEDILEMIGDQQLMQGSGKKEVRQSLFQLLARCLSSDHFQVTERTLLMWNNEHLLGQGCFSQQHSPALLPLIVGPLQLLSEHWNQNVKSLAETTQKIYMEYDLDLFEKYSDEHAKKEAERKQRQSKSEQCWDQLAEQAAPVLNSVITASNTPPTIAVL